MKYRINGNAVAVGTVCFGTMKPEDLIPKFVAEIKRLTTFTPYVVREAENWIEGPKSYYENTLQITDPSAGTPEELHAGYAKSIVDDLMSHLNVMAPDGLRFGAHDGDGADFGWWECCQ